ncbi:MAG: DUF3006 domain-containing protein [Erysipelotrichaceae bacterium]|nr:DUF3006 domain-containing protein [Erysipelotrichaceae bacterium]
MKVIIDRFEGDYAVVELPNETFIDVPKALFPDAKEGDVIDVSVDKEDTERRKAKIEELMKELFKN